MPGERRRNRTAQRPAERARRADPARDTAYQVLRAVADGAYANLELPAALRRARLSGRDAAFATELTYGTIRLQGRYDAVIAVAADRPEGIDPPVRDVLRLGCHQLLALRVPDHAAVSATVALARQHVGAGAGGFVNAVLRRVSERSPAQWDEQVVAGLDDPLARLAVRHSHPEWVVRALRAGLLAAGAASAQTVETELVALLEAHNTPAAVTLVARPGLVTPDEVTGVADPDPSAPTAWTLRSGDPGGVRAVREQRAAVQDAGSQLLTLALLDAPVEQDGGRWLDLCAGPGGKAALLAAEAVRRGAGLVAVEVSAHRAQLVAQALRPSTERSPAIEVRHTDGREVGEREPGAYDRVLVDAPCTGLGALRRRPEARWRRVPADLVGLGPLQRELLASGLAACRPGGVLVYATCSPHLAETRFVVDDVLRRHGGADLLDVRPHLRRRDGSAVPDVGDGPTAQLWPHRHGTDGMFVALLRVRPPGVPGPAAAATP